jgi:phenylalanyl-tRNA synthetase beta chain
VPVINFSISRLNNFLPGKEFSEILECLPYIGLDIEGIDNKTIRLEYSPNRPDFSSDYGIVRALKGLFEIEIGSPKFKFAGKSFYSVNVDMSVKTVRPFIVALVAKKGKLDYETIKQLFAMQEDLHTGIGRRRMKASIGIHNLDIIKSPITYKTVDEDFSFAPLGQLTNSTIKQILKESDIGRHYKYTLGRSKRYPIIIDAETNVLSFPPIINANKTKVDTNTRNLFVEVTAKNQKIAEDILAILGITLFDAGFEIQSVAINIDGNRTLNTPEMDPLHIDIEQNYINKTIGLELDVNEIVKCLNKSRIDAKAINKKAISCTIPRYRTDILHPIDIVEEVVIGYGIYNLKPTIRGSTTSGRRHSCSVYFDIIRQVMAGMGFLEVINYSLISRKVQYELFGIKKPEKVLAVEGTKSIEHEILKDSLIPAFMQLLSHNVHEEYPQKIFELGKIFLPLNNDVKEVWSIGVLLAHNDASYTEAKSVLQTLLKMTFAKTATTKASTSPIFIDGRCADIILDKEPVGVIGEITPLAINNFHIRVPVSAFELNLSRVLPM